MTAPDRDLIGLAVVWLAWTVFHSLTIGPAARRLAGRLWPPLERHWRFTYACLAAASLPPVIWYYRSLDPGPDILIWPSRWLPGLLLILAALIAALGLRAFGPLDFLGLDSLVGRPARLRPDKPLTTGILGWVRHPLYLAAFILLWARNLNAADLVTSTVLSVYLVIGAMIEEKRLEREWGQGWKDYRRRVSACLPIKKLTEFLIKH